MNKPAPINFYSILFEGEFIVYRPFRSLAFIANAPLVQYLRGRLQNPKAAQNPEIETFLNSLQFWEPDPAPPGKGDLQQPYRPTMAVLLMTNRCNLGCTYCYANAGKRPPRDLSLPIATRVIDAACENAQAAGEESFSLAFHGGGEPTVHWTVFTHAVAYARRKPIPCHVSLSTNGVWTPAQRRFILDQVQNVSLSFDGIQDVQDQQRPRSDGTGSFATVMESIRALEDAGLAYGIRATAPAETLHRLPECVAFLCDQTKAQAIQVEPTYTSKRGHYADMADDYAQRFIETFMEAFEIAARAGRSLTYSGARPWVITTAFCQAFSRALIVTPQGKLVTCFEIYDSELPFADPFIIGDVTPDGVQTDQARLIRFGESQRAQRAECQDCFCYWHCCGDCASRRMVSAANQSARCRVNQGITREILAWYIAQGQGVWNGQRGPASEPAVI